MNRPVPDHRSTIGWTLLAWFALAAAIALPVVFDTGLLGHIASWGVGLLLVAALYATLKPDESDRDDGIWLAVASLLFPTVDRYKTRLEERAKVLSANDGIIANMRRIIGIYRLGDGDVGTLKAALNYLRSGGVSPHELTVPKCADAVSRVLVTRVSGPPSQAILPIDELFDDQWAGSRRQVLLSEALQIIFCTDSKAAVRQYRIWDEEQSRDDLALVLARIYGRHEQLTASDGVLRFDEAELVAAIDHLLPGVTLAALVARLKETPAGVVDNMNSALKFYGLARLDAKFKNRVVAGLAGVESLGIPKKCADLVAPLVVGGHSPELLELLYREHVRGPDKTKAVWQEHLPKLVTELAPVLAASGQLQPLAGSRGKGALANVLRHILPDMEQFDHRVVRTVVDRISLVWDDTLAYCAWVGRGGLAAQPQLGDVLERLPDPVSDPAVHWDNVLGPSATVGLLTDHGSEWFETLGASTEEARPLAIVSVGFFVASGGAADPALATSVSRLALRSSALDLIVSILMGTLWRAEASGEMAVSVHSRVMAADWRQWAGCAVETFGESVEAKLRFALGEKLMRGHWPLRLPVEMTLTDVTNQVELLLADFTRMRADMAAGKVSSEAGAAAMRDTLDAFVATRPAVGPLPTLADTARVYVVTFDGSSGPLARLIEFLREPPELIEKLFDKNIYDFVHYTRYARIGHLPDMTFAEFHERFHHDFNVVLHHRRELMKTWDWDNHDLSEIELTLQQIVSSTRYNFETTVFDDDPAPKRGEWLREPSVITEHFWYDKEPVSAR